MLSKGSQTATVMCKYVACKGAPTATEMCKPSAFKLNGRGP